MIIKIYECYYEGNFMCDVKATCEEQAEEIMESRFPYLCYGDYDGCFEIIEKESYKEKHESRELDYMLEEFGI